MYRPNNFNMSNFEDSNAYLPKDHEDILSLLGGVMLVFACSGDRRIRIVKPHFLLTTHCAGRHCMSRDSSAHENDIWCSVEQYLCDNGYIERDLFYDTVYIVTDSGFDYQVEFKRRHYIDLSKEPRDVIHELIQESS